MAYVRQTRETDELFAKVRVAIRKARRAATTLGYGPRFLHSTGQQHKGGPNTVVALQILVDPTVDLPIPGEDYSFGVLERAQAIGDWQSLISHDGERSRSISAAMTSWDSWRPSCRRRSRELKNRNGARGARLEKLRPSQFGKTAASRKRATANRTARGTKRATKTARRGVRQAKKSVRTGRR